jgi:hypothetical protein
MRIFEDDDAGYLAWVESHPHGFVVNTYRRPNSRYLRLHQARCDTICGKPTVRADWTTGQYVKVCSEKRSALD